MYKSLNNILAVFIYLISFNATALNSSSYLIANSALKFLDFEEAYVQFKNYEYPSVEANLQSKLLTLIHLNMLSDAQKIAIDILEINDLNQEAWIVYLTNAKITNNFDVFYEYNNNLNKSEMTLLNYIFFTEKNEIKNNKIAARSIFEIVEASISEDQQNLDYNFLLFYLSIASILDPHFYELYFFSAQIYQNLKDYDKAEIFYKKVSSEHNLYIESQKNIAINKSKSGLFKNGEEKLLKLVQDYPLNHSLIFALANLYRVNKKYEEAIFYYSKVIKTKNDTDSEFWHLYYFRGICFERSDKWNLAEKDFLYSLKIKPDSSKVLNYLAYGWLERGENLIQAKNMLKKAYNGSPNSFYILDSLAWAYFKIGQFDKAAELMEEVIQMAPGEAISLDHLGDIYFALERKREAVYYWKQALDLSESEDINAEALKEKLKKHNAG